MDWIGWLIGGIGIGLLIGQFRSDAREKMFLNYIAWRRPEDYWFFTWQKEQAEKVKPSFKIPDFGFLKKKSQEPPGIKLDPIKKAEEIRQALEKQVSSQDEQTRNYKQFEQAREEMAKAGISAP